MMEIRWFVNAVFLLNKKEKAIPVGMTFRLVDDIGLDLHLRPGMGEDFGCHQFSNWWLQQSTGLL
jgi:hypothetical protein